MKAAIASLLFAGAALAVPMEQIKRAVQTDVVVTTVWTTTTIFVDGPTAGAFAEKKPSSSASLSSSASSSSSVAPPPASSSAASVPAAVAAVVSVAAPVSSAAAEPATPVTPATPAAGAKSFTGEATYYTVSNGVAGSCGMTKTDNDAVVALSLLTMNNGANSNNNPLCGKNVKIQGENGVHTAMIYDSCAGCAAGDIDLSPSLFKTVFPNGDGRVHGVKWWIE